MSRWCDQTIHDARHSVKPNGPLRGRGFVWNSRRGNHLGQRSCASAPTGRTYGRKRSGQNTAKHLARRGPSTYGLGTPYSYVDAERRLREDFDAVDEKIRDQRWHDRVASIPDML